MTAPCGTQRSTWTFAGHGAEVGGVDLGAERHQHAHRRRPSASRRLAVERPGRSRCRRRRSRRRRRRAARRSRSTSPAAAAPAPRRTRNRRVPGVAASTGPRARAARASGTARRVAPWRRRRAQRLVSPSRAVDGEEARDVHVRHAERVGGEQRGELERLAHDRRRAASGGRARASGQRGARELAREDLVDDDPVLLAGPAAPYARPQRRESPRRTGSSTPANGSLARRDVLPRRARRDDEHVVPGAPARLGAEGTSGPM